MEEYIITQKLNPHIDPSLAIWGWEVPVYLFLGGLSAGLLVLAAIGVLGGRKSVTVQRLLLAVPLLLAVGMGALFLDLEHKAYVFRFYTAFMPSSPMSWGSWILLAAVPAMFLLMAATLSTAWPSWHARLTKMAYVGDIVTMSEESRRGIAIVTLVLGVALGIYTGVLLSAYGARPFWNSSILGPLFLVSGMSAAAALAQIGSRSGEERHYFGVIDAGLIITEVVLLALLVINMVSGSLQAQEAADLILGGPLTSYFWVFVVFGGLLIPLFLEFQQIRGKPIPVLLVPAFILVGGLVFRFFMVEAGQASTWIPY